MYIVQDLHVIQNPSNNNVCSYSPPATDVQTAFAMLNKTLNPLVSISSEQIYLWNRVVAELDILQMPSDNSFLPFHQQDSKFIDHPVILLLLRHHKVCA